MDVREDETTDEDVEAQIAESKAKKKLLLFLALPFFLGVIHLPLGIIAVVDAKEDLEVVALGVFLIVVASFYLVYAAVHVIIMIRRLQERRLALFVGDFFADSDDDSDT